MNTKWDEDFRWDLFAGFLVALLMILFFLSSFGCCSAKCAKVVYQPVEVKVPVPVEGPALPLPEPPDCGTAPAPWRDAALYLKECYDLLWANIEELRHIIEAYNETRDVKDD